MMIASATTVVLVVSPSLDQHSRKAYSTRGQLFDGRVDGRAVAPEPIIVAPKELPGANPAVTTDTAPAAHRAVTTDTTTVVHRDVHPVIVTTGHAGGCGSRGGPGYRLPNGKCASWDHKHRH